MIFCHFIANICHLSVGARFDDGMGSDNEVQRTMLELINQLDGFDPRGNIKVCLFFVPFKFIDPDYCVS